MPDSRPTKAHATRDVRQLGSASAVGSPLPQRLLNGEVHDWFRIVHGFPDHLVSGLIEEFSLNGESLVLDPFCGAGTTLVECMKKGIEAIGIDANPASYFAACVKTDWHIDRDRAKRHLDNVLERYKGNVRSNAAFDDDVFVYLWTSGMLDRGWISEKPLKKVLALKKAIEEISASWRYKSFLMLGLLSEVIGDAANIKFGPELYCSTPKENADVLEGFRTRVESMLEDLHRVADLPAPSARVIYGDARKCGPIVRKVVRHKFDAVICSPPYPTEHDYTRNTRLELVLLGKVFDSESLRHIKRGMIRSHTKGIYQNDSDRQHVSRLRNVKTLAAKVEKRAQSKDYGFARLYGTVVREYFGGMRLHFRSIKSLLKASAKLAYVVGDQSSYLRVHVPTAEILSDIANREGLKTVEIRKWRGRFSSTTRTELEEHVLILRN
jgi:hypothetical protein